jgi:cysteine desulfurase
VSIDAMGADSVALSAHKFGGPRGVGALYVRDLDTIRPIMHGGGQERGWRPGTENVPAVVGMARALEIAQERMRAEGPRVAKMADGIRAALLASVPGALNLGHPQHRLYNTVAIALPIDSRQLLSRLDGDGICVSAGSACTRGGDSHALAALGLSPEVRRGSLRISLWYDNTPHQCRVLVERIVHHINELVHEAAPRPIPPTHT